MICGLASWINHVWTFSNRDKFDFSIHSAHSLLLFHLRYDTFFYLLFYTVTLWMFLCPIKYSHEYLSTGISLFVTIHIIIWQCCFLYILFLFCVFVSLAFDEFLQWRNIWRPWIAQRRSHDLERSTECYICFLFIGLGTFLKRQETQFDFFTGEKFWMRPAIGHTIFFTVKKNRMTNQIVSNLWRTIFMWQVCFEQISVLI